MQSSGFFASLLDLSFNNFVTTKVIRVLYVLALVLIGLFAVFSLIGALYTMVSKSFIDGVFWLVLTPVLAAVNMLLARIYTELIIVFFRVAENTTELVRIQHNLHE